MIIDPRTLFHVNLVFMGETMNRMIKNYQKLHFAQRSLFSDCRPFNHYCIVSKPEQETNLPRSKT